MTTGRRLRVLVHAPHLSGVGHHVRLREVARALSLRHQVGYFTGGRPVPGAWPGNVQALPLPGLGRGPAGLAPLGGSTDLAATLAARQAVIRATVAGWRPDAVLIEHYPFSKWELAAEFDALMDAARQANAAVRIVCSVRDIPRQTRHEDCSPAEWSARVARTLNDRFDALLVHGEPALTPLEEWFPAVGGLRQLPRYTGIVAESLPAPDQGASRQAPTGGQPFVLASIGGGTEDAGLLALVRAAWEELSSRGGTGGRRLVLVHGLTGAPASATDTGTDTGADIGADTGAGIASADAGTGITSVPFSPDFLAWLAVADLSISHAGYNTCANLLATRTRAVLVPNPRMSDQAARAERMQSLGVARTLSAAGLAPKALADAIALALQAPRPTHALRLDGAARTAQLLEQLAG